VLLLLPVCEEVGRAPPNTGLDRDQKSLFVPGFTPVAGE